MQPNFGEDVFITYKYYVQSYIDAEVMYIGYQPIYNWQLNERITLQFSCNLIDVCP